MFSSITSFNLSISLLMADRVSWRFCFFWYSFLKHSHYCTVGLILFNKIMYGRWACTPITESLIYAYLYNGMFRPKHDGKKVDLLARITPLLLCLTPALRKVRMAMLKWKRILNLSFCLGVLRQSRSKRRGRMGGQQNLRQSTLKNYLRLPPPYDSPVSFIAKPQKNIAYK